MSDKLETILGIDYFRKPKQQGGQQEKPKAETGGRIIRAKPCFSCVEKRRKFAENVGNAGLHNR